MHPWYNQELTHLEALWEELASETHTGEFLTTSMEALRLELGYQTSLMSVLFDRMAGCATDCWLTSLWETCNKWNIDIKSISPELKRARVYDQFVSQAFTQNKNITKEQLPILNECRCFHEIVTLADIVTACGRYLVRDVLDGKTLTLFIATSGQKKRQGSKHPIGNCGEPPYSIPSLHPTQSQTSKKSRWQNDLSTQLHAGNVAM